MLIADVTTLYRRRRVAGAVDADALRPRAVIIFVHRAVCDAGRAGRTGHSIGCIVVGDCDVKLRGAIVISHIVTRSYRPVVIAGEGVIADIAPAVAINVELQVPSHAAALDPDFDAAGWWFSRAVESDAFRPTAIIVILFH